MLKWRASGIGLLHNIILGIFLIKKLYPQRYEKTLMRWGSGLFWVYFIQCAFGVLLAIQYCLAFDVGLPSVAYIWWETSCGSSLVRLHSEFGNLLFLFLYGHVFTKVWLSLDISDADGYASWVGGSLIFVLTYAAGVTGAVMPWSILSEVTATIVGSVINSVIYIKFDFVETLLIPNMSLNEDAVWRNFIVHALLPLLTLALGLFHMLSLHQNKYSAAGGFKRLGHAPRMRETRRWGYFNRYWSRATGTWYRMFLAFAISRFIVDVLWPKMMCVLYAYANFEYWPVAEDIDFVLAIPHWYLRPIMGALVTLPHHYMGFIYIGLFFAFIASGPWLNERGDDDVFGYVDTGENEGWTTTRWDTLQGMVFSVFGMIAMFTCAIVPTGKYFISIGSMDGLVFSYWYLILYFIIFVRTAFYIWRFHFSGLQALQWVN